MKNLWGKIHLIMRWFVITGVLAGLCFSSGEGIQLLPFPNSPDKAGKVSVQFENGKSKPYSLSVHSTGAHQAFVIGKVQKNHKFFDLDADSFGKLKPAKFTHEPVIQNFQEPAFYIVQNLSASPSKRAPPVI